jgi:hypothetical protein
MFQQQGDVLIVAAKIPGKAKKKNSYILAEGEVTGHAHRVEGDAELLELGEKLFLRVMNGNVRVVHEEHKAQVIPPGEYEIRRVQEYNHFAEEARAVAD